MAETRKTVSFTRNEIKTDRALHFSSINDQSRHQEVKQKQSADRDHAAEPTKVQSHNLDQEEEVDPDLESACGKEAERGHARTIGPVHHVHDRNAKIQKAKMP